MGSAHERVDFASLNGALLDRAETLVPQWLPGGKRVGAEWVCGSLSGGAGRSFSVKLSTGVWADFSGDERGGDLISLYAAIHGLTQLEAARQIMRDLGWASASNSARSSAPAPATQPRRGPPEPPPSDEQGGARKSLWRAITPVPAHAPEPTFAHWSRKPADLVGTWAYRLGGELYGYVVRFQTSDGGKDIMPHTWCVDESDGRGTQRWHWKQWDEPRPLYVACEALDADDARPVVLVEGEKCAQAGHALLGDKYRFVTWPGGSKAFAKACWGWLRGLPIIMWPDCDAKREKLTAAEREAGLDEATKPYLPEARQPGMAAMLGIAGVLRGMGCTLSMCPMPAPGTIPDGWDIADAIASGWDAATVEVFIRGAKPLAEPKAPVPDLPHAPAGASRGGVARDWRDLLLTSPRGQVLAARENIVLALDGLPEQGLAGVPALAGVIGFNEFTNDVVKLKPAPWGTPQGVWDEVDDLLMGEWLTHEHGMPSMPRGTLEEAVRMVAYRHRYHPLRAQFEGLRGRWDGTPRLATWLRTVCMVDDEFDDADPLQQYLARVGTWLIQAIVARVLTPGCKFDYMVVFEGAQGVGKSTLARVLGGAFYADTGLMLGDKDSYQNLQGISVYEMGELDSLNKSEVTKVKLFISSQTDRFRASFDRRPKDYPRQCVFVGTTNEDHYLTDPTGNRRIWPVRVQRQVDIRWLTEAREQLFAEAVARFDEGKRFHPTQREQRELFEPQQQQRAVENAIESSICRYLYDENQRVPMGGENGALVNEVTLTELLAKVGIDIGKLGPGRFHEKQAAAALRRLGWREIRSDRPGRPRVYRRPDTVTAMPGIPQQRQDAGASTSEPKDGCPF